MKYKTLSKLYAAMKTSKGVPAIEETVTLLLDTLRNEEKSIQQYADLITSDFTITQSVLRLANSAMYAPFAKDISSVSTALQIIGSDALNHIVLSVSIVSALEADEDSDLAKTLLSSEISRTVCDPDIVEEVSIISLLSNLGRLIANKFLPEEMALINNEINKGVDPDKAANDVLGMTLNELGIELAKTWNLPIKIISNLDGTGDPEIINIANFTNKVSSLIHSGDFEEAEKLTHVTKMPKLNKTKLKVLVDDKVKKFTLPKINFENTETTLENILIDLIQDIKEHPKKNIEELGRAIFTVFNNTLKTSHCLFFIKNNFNVYSAVYGYGKNINEIKEKFKIPAAFRPTVFHAAIKNNVHIYIDDVSKLKETSLPTLYKDLFSGIIKFVVIPIKSKYSSGLMYCDWETQITLTSNELNRIKELCFIFLHFLPK